MPFPSITGSFQGDGVVYANSLPLPAAEGDLFNGKIGAKDPSFVDPIPVQYNEAIVAIINLVASGPITSQTSYIVMQTDLASDNNWVDVAWLTWSGTSGQATFVLSGGVSGSDSFQQTRAAGTAPSPLNGSNQFPLAGRIRFVGKTTLNPSVAGSSSSSSLSSPSKASASSSSSSGGPLGPAQVVATIKYKLLGLK